MSSSNAVIFITGASRGLGLAIAEKLLEDGNSVVTLQRSETDELKSLSNQYPNTLINKTGSAAEQPDIELAVAAALQAFGRLDAVVLNAGTSIMGTLADTDMKEWHSQFHLNFFGVVAVLLATLPALRESKRPGGGRVIFSSSQGGVTAPAGLAAYAAAKAAMNSLARSLKNEEPNITAVAVHPGMVATDMVRELVAMGKEKLPAPIYNYFAAGMDAEKSGATGIHASVPPEVPAKTFAWLALNAPKELNGLFVNYCDEQVTKLVDGSA
ncbi:NAD(P)-binding protein [Auriculariales sp. MPI-PUGE-AT-0066]|nr:NAD(P)-binding protein [Auriculariales sp. MPI-PUGE-AT-0066]